MIAITGVFHSAADARRARRLLHRASEGDGIRILTLTQPPGDTERAEKAPAPAISVVVAVVPDDDPASGDRAQAVLDSCGADDISRDGWKRIRADADPGPAPESWRRGYEAAISPLGLAESMEEVLDDLRRKFPEEHHQEAFQMGFARGQEWLWGKLNRVHDEEVMGEESET